MQHEAADKEVEFFKTTRYYRNAYEAYLKDDIHDFANMITLQDKTQNQSAQEDEAQKSKDQKNNSLKKKARKCVCEDIHEFKKCSYIVSSARKFY